MAWLIRWVVCYYSTYLLSRLRCGSSKISLWLDRELICYCFHHNIESKYYSLICTTESPTFSWTSLIDAAQSLNLLITPPQFGSQRAGEEGTHEWPHELASTSWWSYLWIFEANVIFNVKSCKLGHDFDEAGKSDGQGLGKVCRNLFLADAA